MLPIVFSRFIIQSKKYKRFDNAYLAEEACKEDLRKLPKKYTNGWCDDSAEKTIRLISEKNVEKNFKLSKDTKKDIEDIFLKFPLSQKLCNAESEKDVKTDLSKIKEVIPKKQLKAYGQNISSLYLNHNENYFRKKIEELKDKKYKFEGRALSINLARKKIIILRREIEEDEKQIEKLNDNERIIYSLYLEKASKRIKNNEKQIYRLENFIYKLNNALFSEIKNDPTWEEVKSLYKASCIDYSRYRYLKKIALLTKESSAMKKCNKESKKREKIFLSKNNHFDGSFDCLHPLIRKDGSQGNYSAFEENGLIKPFYNFKNQDIIIKINKSMIQKYYLY